jgi:hypothetical protein
MTAIIIAAIIAIPVILIPVALVWYINASGLYQVLKDAKASQKARALKGARAFVAVKK